MSCDHNFVIQSFVDPLSKKSDDENDNDEGNGFPSIVKNKLHSISSTTPYKSTTPLNRSKDNSGLEIFNDFLERGEHNLPVHCRMYPKLQTKFIKFPLKLDVPKYRKKHTIDVQLLLQLSTRRHRLIQQAPILIENNKLQGKHKHLLSFKEMYDQQ